MSLDAVLRAGRRLEAEAPARFRLEAAGPLARGAEAPTAWPFSPPAKVYLDHGHCPPDDEACKEAVRKEEEARQHILRWKETLCGRLPDGNYEQVNGFVYEPYGNNGKTKVVKVTEHTMSHAFAFELVRQALTMCGDSATQHPLVQVILKTVYARHPNASPAVARFLELNRMLIHWTGRNFEVPLTTWQLLTNETNASLLDKFDGSPAKLDATAFLFGLFYVGIAPTVFTALLPAAVVIYAGWSRWFMINQGLQRREELKGKFDARPNELAEFFTQMENDETRWKLARMKKLFEWVETLLKQVLLDHFQANYYKPAPDQKFTRADGKQVWIQDDASEHRAVLAFTDELETDEDAVRIRTEMQWMHRVAVAVPPEQQRLK